MPSVAQAQTYHWASGLYTGPGQAWRDPQSWVLAGVYCHELDAFQRNIEIRATYPNGAAYGTWVSFTTDGYRSYAGQYVLSGACRNPHSVGYHINAHDNYFI